MLEITMTEIIESGEIEHLHEEWKKRSRMLVGYSQLGGNLPTNGEGTYWEKKQKEVKFIPRHIRIRLEKFGSLEKANEAFMRQPEPELELERAELMLDESVSKRYRTTNL